jgi:hypothetical protein
VTGWTVRSCFVFVPARRRLDAARRLQADGRTEHDEGDADQGYCRLGSLMSAPAASSAHQACEAAHKHTGCVGNARQAMICLVSVKQPSVVALHEDELSNKVVVLLVFQQRPDQ